MAITLNWTNKNTGITNFKVYRGTSRGNLSLLTTLASTALTYSDTSASNNVLYYYQINAVIGASEEIPGSIVPYANITDTGPGPQTLVRGTMEFGYFGTLAAADFVASSDMQAAFPVGSAYATAVTFWFKMACNGKVLFIPNQPARSLSQSTVNTLNGLYNAGCLLGTGEATVPHAAITAGSTPVMQNKKVTFGAYEFYARMPKAAQSTDIKSNLVIPATITPDIAFSEASLMASLNTTWLATPASIAAGAMPSQPHSGNSALVMGGATMLTQHATASNVVALLNTNGTVTSCVYASPATSSITAYIYGILELIPSS